MGTKEMNEIHPNLKKNKKTSRDIIRLFFTGSDGIVQNDIKRLAWFLDRSQKATEQGNVLEREMAKTCWWETGDRPV